MSKENSYLFLNTPPNWRTLGLRRPGSSIKRTNKSPFINNTSFSTDNDRENQESSTPQMRRILLKKPATEPAPSAFHPKSYEEHINDNSPASSISIGGVYSKNSSLTASSRGAFRLSLNRIGISKINRKRLEFINNENTKLCKNATTNLTIDQEIQRKQKNSYNSDTSFFQFLTLKNKVGEHITEAKNIEKSSANSDKENLRSSKNLDSLIDNDFVIDVDQLPTEEIFEHIERLKLEIKWRQDYLLRTEELRQAIEVWRSGFIDALKDFRQNFLPHCSYCEVLSTLQIPAKFLHYVDS